MYLALQKRRGGTSSDLGLATTRYCFFSVFFCFLLLRVYLLRAEYSSKSNEPRSFIRREMGTMKPSSDDQARPCATCRANRKQGRHEAPKTSPVVLITRPSTRWMWFEVEIITVIFGWAVVCPTYRVPPTGQREQRKQDWCL